jgi:phycocyanin-associated, rod
MLGQSALTRGSASSAENRTFVYEVTGMRQNDRTAQNDYPIRTSGSTFIQVSYDRMNEEMRRIARMGGKIVKIHPAGTQQKESESEA